MAKMRGEKGRGLEFCCCALPLINFGSYTICIEFLFVALCVGLLAVGPPSIVATNGAIPSGWPKAIVCVLGFIIAAWQIFGIISIKTERTKFYRTYIRINFILTILTIIVTLAFFAVSAARHSTALDSCIALYGNSPAGSSTTALQNAGQTICNIFIWVQVGCMGLLILLIGLTQLYMCYCQRAYGQEMRRADRDHKTYAGQNHEGIPLAERGSGIWEADAVPTSMPLRQDRRSYGPGYDSQQPDSDESIRSHDQLHSAPISYNQRQSYNQRNSGIYSQSYPAYTGENTASYESSHQQSYDSQPDHHHYGNQSGGYREPY